MKNKLCFILLLTFLSNNSFSQIANEIESYVDSTEILVQKGRKMLFNELNESNLGKTKEIYDYLTNITKNQHYSAFYYIEDLYINMLTSDWESVELLISDYEKYKSKNIYSNTQELIYKLRAMTIQESEQVFSSCIKSSVNEQIKRIVDILLHYIKSGDSDYSYNKKLDLYKKEFKNSQYENFEKEFLPKKILKTSWNISFGSGMLFTTKDLSKNFSNNASFNMGMDVNVQKIFTSLYIHGTNLKLQEPFMAVSDIDTMNFKFGEKFSYFDAGLKAGYFLIRNERFHLTPYVSISGSYLESTRYKDTEDNDLEYEIFNSFTYGAGLHTEIKIYEFTNSYYYGGMSNTYLSIKLETGYNKILKFKDTYAIGDTPYINCAFVVGFGQF